MITKQEIRRKIKDKRSLLLDSDVKNLSNLITKKVLDLNLDSYNSFFVYKSFMGEVDTSKLITYLLSKNKTVLYPLIIGDEMYACKPLSNTFTKDKYGILVPSTYEILDSVDVAFIPLVACDLNKTRLGFGKGYYDKFLTGKNLLKIGLSYEFQVVDKIPSNEWDVKLDLIITESRIIK